MGRFHPMPLEIFKRNHMQKKDFYKSIAKNYAETKTRIYNASSDVLDQLSTEETEIPSYKTLLVYYDTKYRQTMRSLQKKPISINALKLKYGLPNNANDYFNIKPDHPQALLPRTISEKHAYILILFYQMHLDDANLFLEALKLPLLNGRFATPLNKLIYYCLKQGYEIEAANELICSHLGISLYE